MRLAIVIINFRTPGVTIDCLKSLADQIGEARVFLVDNASGDDSIPKLHEAISENHWEWVTLIESETNRGFAGGNNLGMTYCKDAEFILLLNSDTIAKPGVLDHAMRVIASNDRIGIMSCLLLNADGSVQNTARKFPTPMRQGAYALGLPWSFPKLFGWANVQDPGWDRATVARDVEWVGGAFMLLRRKMVDEIGPLDEDFFFYGEDAEYCHRARMFGWRVRYDPESAVVHLGGASSDSKTLAEREKNILTWQARYLMQKKCWGVAAEMFIRYVDYLAHVMRWMKLSITGRGEEAKRQWDVIRILSRWPAFRVRGHS